MKKLFLIIFFALAGIMPVLAQTSESTDSISKDLQEIVVTANQPATKLVGNSLVSIISGSSLQNVGTCLDVLGQLPMISIQDDDIQIIGRGNPEIYIDGRPLHDVEVLKQLLSNNISKVELIMAPGAAYSSETTAVLKITTKRNFIKSFSVTDRVEAIAKRKWSANNMLDLNYRVEEWDIFATGTIAHNNSLIKGTTTNYLDYNGVPTIVGSTQHNEYPSTNSLFKAGFNYAKGEQSFGAYLRYNIEHADFKNKGSEWFGNEAPVNRNISRKIKGHSILGSAYYDNTFLDKYNLHFDGNIRESISKTGVITIYPDSEISDIISHDEQHSILFAGKLYLSCPMFQGNFIIGTQNSYTHTSLDYLMLNPDVEAYLPSSVSDSKQLSLAAFASWGRTFGKLNINAGLRYEYVDYLYKINGKKDDEVSRRTHVLTPDLSASWWFDEQTQASLSYRLTTLRAPYSQLTGSLNYVGMHEIEGGNPSLRDEQMHNMQLFGMWKDFMMQVDYTRSLDTYGFVKRLYPANTLQLIMQPININVSSMDMYLIWNKNIGIWTPNITAGVHKQWLTIDERKYNHPIFSYYFNNIVSLPNNFLLTLNAYGQSKGDMHTNRFGATWCSIDASISKSFFNRSLQLKLSATDILNTSNNDWSMYTFGVEVIKHQSYDRRGISLTLTYRFNPQKSKYKGEEASEAEMKRLK